MSTAPNGRGQLLQVRHDVAADWAAVNPILAYGEPGWDASSQALKIGDGATPWAALAEVDRAGRVLGSVSITNHVATAYSPIATIVGLSGLVVPDLSFPVDLEMNLPMCWSGTAGNAYVAIIYDGAGAPGTGTLYGTDRIYPTSVTNTYAKTMRIVCPLPAHNPGTFRVDCVRTVGAAGTMAMDLTANIPAFLRFIGR